MYIRKFFFASFVILVGLADSAPKVPKLPEDLIRCHRRGPIEELNECMRKGIEDGFRNLKNGDPSINVDEFDPLTVPEIRSDRSNGPVNIQITQKNGVLTGISGAKVKKIKFNWDKKTMYGEFYVPKIVHISDQTISGRILLFPIAGSGKATITSIGYRSNFTGHFKEYEKNGYHYWKFDEESFTYRVTVDKMEFKFENLFNGDKTLGDEMNRVLNDNWKVLASEVNPVTEMIFGKMLFNALNRFYGKVPLEEVFFD